MAALSAQDLKLGGIRALEQAMHDTGEAIVTVRGKQRYVVMHVDAYNRIREMELAQALDEARADVRARRCVAESVDKHIKRIAP
jgi:hypothetical protein